MNAFDRVMHTLQGRPSDRVPVFATLGAYGGRLTGTDLATLYSDPSAYVLSQEAVQDTFGFDLVLAPFDLSALGEAFGGETAFFADQPPNLKRPGADDLTKAMTLPLPDPSSTGRLPFILESTRRLADRYRSQIFVAAVVPGPVSLPTLLVGFGPWMEALLFSPERAEALLDRTRPFLLTWCEALLEAGADCLIVTEGMAAAEVTDRALFAERILPRLRSTFAAIPGLKVFHHTGGRIGQVLDLLPCLPGLAGVSISSQDDLGEARRHLGPDLALLGNLDNLSFSSVSADEIHRRALKCLAAMAVSGRFILSTAGGDIPLATPPANLHALAAASRAYGAGERRLI